MWALAFVIFVSCKWLTWRRTRSIGLPWWLHVGYLMAWPGLDARHSCVRKEHRYSSVLPGLNGVAHC
jgi:hypothetical protein